MSICHRSCRYTGGDWYRGGTGRCHGNPPIDEHPHLYQEVGTAAEQEERGGNGHKGWLNIKGMAEQHSQHSS